MRYFILALVVFLAACSQADTEGAVSDPEASGPEASPEASSPEASDGAPPPLEEVNAEMEELDEIDEALNTSDLDALDEELNFG